MNNSLSSVVIAVDMATLLEIARKNQKNNLIKKRMTNAHKFRKKASPNKIIE